MYNFKVGDVVFVDGYKDNEYLLHSFVGCFKKTVRLRRKDNENIFLMTGIERLQSPELHSELNKILQRIELNQRVGDV